MIDQDDKIPRPRPRNKGALATLKNARMRASGNAIFTERSRQEAADLRSRNAYRAAIGLPLIQPGNE